MAWKKKKLVLHIGKRLQQEVESLEEARDVYAAERDNSGEGFSTFPTGKVDKYTISYNARVWDGNVLVLEGK